MKSQIVQPSCNCGKLPILVKVTVSRPRSFLAGQPNVKADWMCKCGRKTLTDILYLEIVDFEVSQ